MILMNFANFFFFFIKILAGISQWSVKTNKKNWDINIEVA